MLLWAKRISPMFPSAAHKCTLNLITGDEGPPKALADESCESDRVA